MRQLRSGANLSTDCAPAGTRSKPLAARGTERRFLGAAALLFAAAALLTALCCDSMASMPSMSMPGGWTLSMTWMRMPGQSWFAASASFIVMWSVMMVAMMLPSLLPMLWRFRATVGLRAPRCEQLTAVVAAGYFLVWILLGAAVFALGAPLAAAEMQLPPLSRAAPLASGLVVLAAGALQFTPWKARALEYCKVGATCAVRLPCALRHGLQLGMRCSACCGGPTAVLVALGIMDLHVMAGITALISGERLAPAGARLARIGGLVLIAMGLYLLGRAVRGGGVITVP